MMDTENQGDLPDKMNIWTTLGGYGLCALVIFLMFYLAEPAYN